MFSVISKITVKLTTFCNLACEYCHQLDDDKKHHVSFDKWEELKDFLMHSNLADTVEVTLTGGEISLLPEEYGVAVKWFQRIEQQKDVSFTFAVVSNGTNIENIFKQIKRKKLNPKRATISWDGIYSSSKSRKPKIAKYDDKFFNDMVVKIGQSKWNHLMNISHAITPDTVDYLHESFVFALDNGIRNIGFYYIHEADYSDPVFLQKFEEQMWLLGEEFCKRYPRLEDRWVYYNWQLLYAKENVPTDNKAVMQATTMCHKLGRTLHFDPYGDIYGCIYFGDHRALKLGDLNRKVLEKQQLVKFTDQYLTMPNCNLDSCGNSHCFECPASNYVHNGEMSNRFSNTCSMLAIEKRVYNELKPKLNLTELDKKFYWMEQDHLGEKGFNEKIRDNINLPVTEEQTIPDDVQTKKPSDTFTNVVTWHKKEKRVSDGS